MSSGVFDAFVDSHKEWDEVLTWATNKKKSAELCGNKEEASAFSRVEDLLYKEVEDLAFEWGEQGCAVAGY
jgi:hypothetical protein